MQELTLPLELVNKLVNYLGTRPYAEVAGLIEAISKQAKLSVKEEVKDGAEEQG